MSNVYLLKSDLDSLKVLDSHLYYWLKLDFSIVVKKDKRNSIDLVILRLKRSKNRAVSLCHQFHIHACECYRTGDFSNYLLLDSIMFKILHSL